MTRALPILVVLILGAAAFYGVYLVTSARPARSGIVHAVGRVDGERVVVAARSAGRVTDLPIGEGESVALGQIVAHIEDVHAAQRLAEARRALTSLESHLRIEQAELAILQVTAPLMVGSADAAARLAQAEHRQREEAEQQQRLEIERLQAIEEPDDEVLQQLAQLELAHEASLREVEAAKAALDRAEHEHALARAADDEVSTRIGEVQALRSDTDAAELAFRQLEQHVTSSTLLSPIAGVIARRHAQIGDDADVGKAILELVAANSFAVVVELSESEATGISGESDAKLYLETHPDQPINARVTRVFSQLDGNRTSWVIRLQPVHDEEQRMMLGVRADVVIRVDEKAPWETPIRKR